MGVAPLFFLAERLVHGQQSTVSRKPLVLIGAKTKSQLLCEKEFQDLGCDVKIATDDGSCGYKGYITDLLEEALSTVDCGLSTVYACGPQPMLKEVSKVSCKYNISVQVSLESHMACGIGACLGCVVRTKNPTCPAGRQEQRAKNGFIYARVCKEGPVFNAQEIEW
ncbi:MAG: hypothetical protein KKE64_06130 [Candidatus Omnitrophica bacterium]|nr:hypothetical protein [Candidatus Omnitrophota bacterium]